MSKKHHAAILSHRDAIEASIVKLHNQREEISDALKILVKLLSDLDGKPKTVASSARKGTGRRKKSPRLTPAQWKALAKRLDRGETYAAISADTGLAHSTIARARSRG